MSVAKSIGTALAVRGCKKQSAWIIIPYGLLTTNLLVTNSFSAPPHHYVVPSPYEQGESAVRSVYSSACVLVFLTGKYD